ncbi:hypothetical protein [Chryseobacterium hagamense]|uniref:Uncharacterized protein n=1 Tax=Chryseobacterium hagamense TaxID=395935 RepID=A0A511YQU2_9FLAO|nr:hypothetical protein [Chryseobacterium hagamense]GEN77561.1 hypothetical protein CHA01nite_33010 [Chryseobacterium hagamense]
MKRTKLYIFITSLIIIVLAALFFNLRKKKPEETIVAIERPIKEAKENIKEDSLIAFTDFVRDFNSHKAENIDRYIDPELGMMLFFHDGPYPILMISSTIKDEIDRFSQDIFENINSTDSPEYLGDFEFFKTGFFIRQNDGEFSLKDFDNTYTSHPESFFKKNRQLETSCNFSAVGISKGQTNTYHFYFKLEGNKLTLLGLSTDSVSDDMFANPKAAFIPFDNKGDIENYFQKQKLFRDKANNAYIDFDKKKDYLLRFSGRTVYI